MLFNSTKFIFFFALFTSLYYAIPARFRNILLLAGSYYFYFTWKPIYLTILVGLTLLDFFLGLGLEKFERKSARTAFLVMSVTANLGLLYIFKYLDFTREILKSVLGHDGPIPALHLALPLGISFHTFQSISYIVDIYRGKSKPERSLFHYALFIAFFPQIVAGPIERAENLLVQFKTDKFYDENKASSGLVLMFWGLFKKVIMADRLAVPVAEAFSSPEKYHGVSMLLALYAFAFQIYCDFSGYTDIARGCARILGYELTLNFNMPYLSSSVREFWRRWHISLSNWFRDYFYIPVGKKFGDRVPQPRLIAAFLTMTVSGIWHGARWNFIIWGMLHGALICFEPALWYCTEKCGRLFKAPESYVRILNTLITFHLVVLAWVWFRTETVQTGIDVTRSLFQFSNFTWSLPALDGYDAWIALLGMPFILVVEWMSRRPWNLKTEWRIRFLDPALVGTLMVILLVGAYTETRPFIYFQF